MYKKLLLASVALGFVAAPSASAMELWDQHVRTTDVGEYAGLLPPPGVYFVDDNFYAGFNDFDSTGHKIPGTSLDGFVNAPVLLWVPGIKLLGGDYAAAIAQPFDYTATGPGYGFKTGAGNIGIYNTIVVPGVISWNFLPLFVKAGLTVYMPDGTNTPANILKGTFNNGGLPSANAFATIQPDLGLTMFLPGGWSGSASFHLAFPIGSDKVSAAQDALTYDTLSYDYHSGDLFMGDYTISKKINDNWTVGIGGSTQNQITKDTQTGTSNIIPALQAKGDVANYEVSMFASYQFKSGISLTGLYSHNLYTASDVGGDIYDLRIVTAF